MLQMTVLVRFFVFAKYRFSLSFKKNVNKKKKKKKKNHIWKLTCRLRCKNAKQNKQTKQSKKNTVIHINVTSNLT